MSEIALALAGRYRLLVKDAKTHEVKRDSGWFDNLILNAGLNQLGSASGVGTHCYVGSGSTAPAVTDTVLQTPVASTTPPREFLQGVEPVTGQTLPAYRWLRVTHRFAEGAAAGNLSEVGIGWSGGLFSRALILDAQGAPTTITVLSNEFLDVVYEVRVYWPQADVTGTLDLGMSQHTTIARASQVTEPGAKTAEYFFNLGMTRTMETFDLPQYYDGDISTPDNRPGGLSRQPDGGTSNALPYVNNSLRSVFRLTSSLENSNFTGGIRSLVLATPICRFQFQYEPKIQKNNTNRLSMDVAVSWARKT